MAIFSKSNNSMHPKVQFHLLGWVTLLLFPAIGLWALAYFENQDIVPVLELDSIFTIELLLGIELGFFYGALVLLISRADLFKEMSNHQQRLFRSLDLRWVDIIFMSLCAAIGEEILFRAAIQTWFGPWITSLIFIAVHGYFNPLSLKKSMLGFILLPFILLLSYGYELFGLWFSIGAHFSYDLLMFQGVLKSNLKKE